MKQTLIILYLIATVLIGAIADGMNDTYHQAIGHAFEALEVGMLLMGAFVFRLKRRDWVAFLAAYICFRIVGFDYTYNIASGRELFAMGTSNLWDMFLNKVPGWGLLFIRVVFCAVGVSIPFKYLRYVSR